MLHYLGNRIYIHSYIVYKCFIFATYLLMKSVYTEHSHSISGNIFITDNDQVQLSQVWFHRNLPCGCGDPYQIAMFVQAAYLVTDVQSGFTKCCRSRFTMG